MRDSVDEVCETGQSSGETDCWAVESSDEDLWVRVEGLGDVEVVGDEAGQEVTVHVGSLWGVTAEGDISSTVYGLAKLPPTSKMSLRREEAASAGQNGHDDLVVGCDLTHVFRQSIVSITTQSTELLRVINGDNSNTSSVLHSHGLISHFCNALFRQIEGYLIVSMITWE